MEADMDIFANFLNSRCKTLKAYDDITQARADNQGVRVFASD